MISSNRHVLCKSEVFTHIYVDEYISYKSIIAVVNYSGQFVEHSRMNVFIDLSEIGNRFLNGTSSLH